MSLLGRSKSHAKHRLSGTWSVGTERMLLFCVLALRLAPEVGGPADDIVLSRGSGARIVAGHLLPSICRAEGLGEGHLHWRNGDVSSVNNIGDSRSQGSPFPMYWAN